MARGDHIYVNCLGYTHHGIDCGDGRVIHFDFSPAQKFAGKFSSLMGEPQNAEICESSYDAFSGGREILTREYPELKRSAALVEEVIERAKSRIGETDYHLCKNNCEHFAEWCVTGAARSEQVNHAKKVSAMVAVGFAATAAMRFLPVLSPPLRVLTVGATLAAAGRRYFAQKMND